MKSKIDAFIKYNIARLRKAKQFDQLKADFLFKFIPLLLHVNHPDLPGFLEEEGSPCGIFGLIPRKIITPQLYELRFPFAPSLAELSSFTHPIAAIQSLKTIGSIGTIAQSHKSDCDFWVSIDLQDLGQQGVALLRKKCCAIEQWAFSFGIEVHFFLMDIKQTRENSFESSAEDESAGSSLKLLLKDELFRTHILVAGKALLWWLIPPGLNEEQYLAHADNLLGSGIINPDLFIDLGYISDIPDAEIFGACLWQMNKALDSPFKSVIKFAYLELLLNRRQKALPLFSDRIKCLVTYPEKLPPQQQKELRLEEVDPYLLLAQDIINLYKGQADNPEEAELISRCLFLKTLEGMEIERQGEQSVSTMNTLQLMEKWQMLPADFDELLTLKSWNFRQLAGLGNAVHRYLINTYKRLRKIFRSFQDKGQWTITERDIAVLGRKLFTFYEKKTDKVDFLRSISRDSMGQEEITIHVTKTNGHNLFLALQGKLDNHKVKANADMILRRERGLIPLLVWLWVNGLLHTETNLYLTKVFFPFSLADIRELVKVMHTCLPKVDFAHISGQQLLQPERIMHALVVVNLEKLPVKGNKKLFSTIISANSYGEFFVNDYETASQLKNALALLLTRHYVSRWKNNLHFFVPPQPEQRFLQSMLGI